MAWKFRFRKTISRGPFRWTLSKKGVSTSWGFPGFRIGVSPDGKQHITIGIPGTGLYWTNNLNSSTPANTKNQPPKISNPVPTNPLPQNQNPNSIPWWKQKGLKP